MPNYRLTMSYDGTNRPGWQRLAPNDRSIQGRLEAALTELFGQPVEVNGSGRTDAGVHAAGQVASFTAPERDPEELLRRLRHLLPADIGALTLEQAPPRFHARLSAVGKTYVYRIWNSPVPDVFARRFRVCVPQRLDDEAMRRAAADLVGTHDFTSFCVRGKKSAVRTLTELSVRREGDALTLTFSADGFLHHMVRILTGTLLEVGLGKRPAGSMPALLAEKRRAAAGQTAPAAGLCLMEVRYP